MNETLALWSASLPSLTLGAGGVVLLPTRARASGVAAVVASVSMLTGLAAFASGADALGRVGFVGGVEVAACVALLLYPDVRRHHPVDYCAFVVVLASGVLGTAYFDHGQFGGTMTLPLGLALIAHLWWRYEHSDAADRDAILWVALSLGTASIVVGHLAFLTTDDAATVGGSVLYASLGPAMALGVRRPRVVDVRGLIVRVVVLGVVFVAYVAIFVGLVALLDMLGQPRPSTGVLAVVGVMAATTFHPLRVMLRGVIDEMLFGNRPDPLGAAAQVVDRIGDDPVLALRAIREALVLPYASLSSGGVELATSGTPVTHLRRLPLGLGTDTVGEITVGLRPGDLTLSTGDERVLRIVAPLLAQTLRARALADDLQASRGQAIAAIEEERRRLRRDLHDGLGPTLSGIALTADAARNSLREDPSSADDLLRGLRAEAVAAVGEIRRLVYDMRPPALDELGLVAALRQRAGLVRTQEGRPLRVAVDVPAELPALTAAVEAAAYRIALEALTNAARHSGTDEATVCLVVDGGHLGVVVQDRGRSRDEWVAGVGLASMRERAAEVGGTLTVVRRPDGARVEARLPLG